MYHQKSPDSIKEMFDSIAKNYDRTNAVNSLGMHRFWLKTLVKELLSFQKKQSSPLTYLDLCSGTGDLAFCYLKYFPISSAYLVDFSPNMLTCAKEKARKNCFSTDLSFIEADVEQLPFDDNTADVITMAYGIRNVRSPEECLAETYRVLKPGGYFAILELTRPPSYLMRLGHTVYLKTVLPLVGKLLASNKKAYQYLCNSINQFISPSELEALFIKQGFNATKRKGLACGIATILIGHKPK